MGDGRLAYPLEQVVKDKLVRYGVETGAHELVERLVRLVDDNGGAPDDGLAELGAAAAARIRLAVGQLGVGRRYADLRLPAPHAVDRPKLGQDHNNQELRNRAPGPTYVGVAGLAGPHMPTEAAGWAARDQWIETTQRCVSTFIRNLRCQCWPVHVPGPRRRRRARGARCARRADGRVRLLRALGAEQVGVSAAVRRGRARAPRAVAACRRLAQRRR